ncbi:ABC transporter permease [Pannus brasiliensis CCIBt3594]|uniref:ABC transporter permease n=1 Tax=Pannus brasiliensis CCIBt3594 TaxID=1427578 RepID=A0AAW9QU90_9CHRO
MINNIWAIFRKEFLGYFTSPTAYIIVAVFWLIAGFFFNSLLYGIILAIANQERSGLPVSRDVVYEFLTTFIGSLLPSLLLVLLPALSMGLYTDEKKQGTLELLATSPLTNWSVALGKLLGTIALFTVMIVPFWIYEIVIFSAASPPVNLQGILLSHLGLLLLASSIFSIGMFISAITGNNIISYIVTFIVVLVAWLLDVIAGNVESFFRDRIGGDLGERIGFFCKEILSHLSWFESFNNFVLGIFDSSSLVLFLSYIFLGIFLTSQAIEASRFQRN